MGEGAEPWVGIDKDTYHLFLNILNKNGRIFLFYICLTLIYIKVYFYMKSNGKRNTIYDRMMQTYQSFMRTEMST